MKFIERLWYGKHPLRFVLAPLSWLFCIIVFIRKLGYKYRFFKSYQAPVPVIIVGNITVGGTGKTPLVSWLGQFLKKQGYKPGIISRGYGGQAQEWPQEVHKDSDPRLVGDEPVLLARQTGCPVVVAPKRATAVQSLLKNQQCNLIISDDGLQHYGLHRNIEIVVLDGTRRFGNQYCLPAGPLREQISRLNTVDFIVTTGDTMQYQLKSLRGVSNNKLSQDLSKLRGQTVHAIAGIGNPARFFRILRDNDLKLHCHEWPDHHNYIPDNIEFNDNLPVIMTEKDAVKCQKFANSQHWYLPIEAQLPKSYAERLLKKLERINNG
jgi:tetraacyldisaccharide 4'-kinase